MIFFAISHVDLFLDAWMPCFWMPGRAAAKGLQPRAAACHMVTTKPGRFFPCFSKFFDLQRPQVGQNSTCDGNWNCRKSGLLDLRLRQKFGGKCNLQILKIHKTGKCQVGKTLEIDLRRPQVRKLETKLEKH